MASRLSEQSQAVFQLLTPLLVYIAQVIDNVEAVDKKLFELVAR